MWETSKRVFLAVALLAAAFWAYGKFAVPWLEGEVQRKVTTVSHVEAEPAPLIDDHTELERYLPVGAWEFGPKKRLQTEHGKAYFHDYKPTEDGRLEVTPFTLIFHDQKAEESGKPPAEPLILRAPDGAVLTFEKPLTRGLADLGQIQHAMLKGEVQVYRLLPEMQPGEVIDPARADLHFKTNNVQFDGKRLLAPNRVEFRFGPHEGIGSNLAIELLPKGATKGTSRVPAIAGIRSLELVRLEKLVLRPSSQGLDPQKAKQLTQSFAPDSVVTINCDGPFYFDAINRQASFRQNVRIIHTSNQQKIDEQVQCQTLAMSFSPKEGEGVSPTAVLNGKSTTTPATTNPEGYRLDKMQLATMAAYGTPAIISSSRHDLRAEADKLFYDFIKKHIELEDDNNVLLIHKNLRFEAPNLQYDLTSGSELGNARSVGKGRLTRIPSAKETSLEVTWQEELLLRPDDGMHAISLYGKPKVIMNGSGTFSANELHIWLKEVEARGSSSTLGNRSGATPFTNAAGESSKKTNIVPGKMLAVGNVKAESPEMIGDVQRLEIFWTQFQSSAVQIATGGANSGATTIGPNGSAATPAGPFSSGPSRQEGPPKQTMHFQGNIARAQVVQADGKQELSELTVDGQAQVWQIDHTKGDAKTLAINGQKLQLSARGGGLFEGIVLSDQARGLDATIEANGLTLLGKEIHLNQVTNRMWMENSGRALISPPPKNGAANGAPELIAAGKPTEVTWQGGLEFDGATVRIRKKLQVLSEKIGDDGSVSKIQLNGDNLDILLNQKVDFANTNRDGINQANIKPHSLVMTGPVHIEQETRDRAGNIESVEKLDAEGAGIEYETGRLLAGGPGVAMTIRKGSAPQPGQPQNGFPVGQPGLGPAAPGNNFFGAGAGGEGLVFIRVDYAGQIEGNIYSKQMSFVNQVEAYHEKVANWDNWLTQEILRNSQTAFYLKCERLELAQIAGINNTKATAELRALKNAYVRTGTTEAMGDRIVYDEAKDLLILEGDQRQDAQLFFQQAPNRPRDFAYAKSIKFWKGTGALEVSGVSSVSATYSGSLKSSNDNR